MTPLLILQEGTNPMKTRLTIALLLALAVTASAFAQPAGGKGQGGGGRRGMGGSMMYVEQSWAALCFDINLTADQISKLKPTYAWAYKSRNDAMKAAMANHDFAAAGKTMEYVKKTVDERIPLVLSAAQKTAWKKWQADQEAMRSRMRQGFQAGAKGGGKGAGKAGGQK